jgi:hypothetical protein
MTQSNQNKNLENSISNSNINKDKDNNNKLFSFFSISSFDNHNTKDNSNDYQETKNKNFPLKVINQKNYFLQTRLKYNKSNLSSNKQLIQNKNKKIQINIKNNIDLQDINSLSFSVDMKRSFNSISKKYEKKIKLIDIEKNIEKNRTKYMSYREKYNIKKTRDIFLRFKSKIDLKIFKMKE